jgi:ABC-type transport system involved in multi-copper enzyme maturation permease subunit
MRLVALAVRSIAQARYLLAGSILLLAGFQFVVVGQAAALQQSQGFGRVAELLPSFLQRGLGQQALLLATFQGIVSFGYFHPVIVVLVALLAAYFATEPAYDVEAGRVDLLLARAVPRRRLVTRSWLLALAATIVMAAAMAFGTWAGLRLFTTAPSAAPPALQIARLIAHLLAVAWCIAAFALAVSAGASRWSSAFTIVVLTTVAMYWLDFLAIAWPGMRAIAWISPFDYYPAIPIMAGTAPAWSNLVVLWTATVVFVAVAYWRFERRDL